MAAVKTARTKRRGGQSAPLAAGQSVFAPREYQKRAIADRSRSKAYMWSRQTGKGFSVALEINADILDVEGRGDATDWMIVSRSLIAARQLGRKVRGIARAMTQAMQAVEPSIEDLGENNFEIVYPGGSRVLILSSSPDAAVGFTGNVVIDEIDTHKQAFDLLENTLPVASTGDFRVIVTSTPRGRRVMHKLWSESQRPDPEWSFHKLTIHDAVAQGCNQDPARLQRQIANDLKWRQEYLCEFVDDEICWIPWELIVGCTSDLALLDPQAGARLHSEHEIYAGWDVARWNDLSVLTLLAKVGSTFAMAGMVVMRNMEFSKQIATIDRTLKLFPRARRLVIDQTSIGEMPYETASKQLRISCEGIKLNNALKETIAGDMRRVMEDRSLMIADDEGIQTDFHSLRRSQMSSGRYRFEGETADSHADRFWSCAYALHGAMQPSGALTGPSGVRIAVPERALEGL